MTSSPGALYLIVQIRIAVSCMINAFVLVMRFVVGVCPYVNAYRLTQIVITVFVVCLFGIRSWNGNMNLWHISSTVQLSSFFSNGLKKIKVALFSPLNKAFDSYFIVLIPMLLLEWLYIYL